jgi:hypothetical protein
MPMKVNNHVLALAIYPAGAAFVGDDEGDEVGVEAGPGEVVLGLGVVVFTKT